MSGQTPAPTNVRGRINHPVWSFAPVLALSAFLGMPAYFIAFLFAYGFRDTVGSPEHLQFLVSIAIFATGTGFASLLAAIWESEAMAGQLIAFGILTSLALNSMAVGFGSIVSALNKDQNSVSADFSTTTDVLVATALFGFATAGALLANAARRTTAAA